MANSNQTTEYVHSVPVVSPTETLMMFPLISEKAGLMAVQNKYAFKVPFKARKVEIRKALEKQYGVKIAAVNIIRIPGKTKKFGRTTKVTQGSKKAIVTLKADSKKFDVVESV